MTKVNAQIEEKKTELDDAKQEVNELICSERLERNCNSIRQLNNENIQRVRNETAERKIIRYAVRNRKSPEENRRRVGKSLSLLSYSSCQNLRLLSERVKNFGKDLVQEAKKVHQTTKTWSPAKRGPSDRNGTPIAEDATSYNVYAVIDKTYKSQLLGRFFM